MKSTKTSCIEASEAQPIKFFSPLTLYARRSDTLGFQSVQEGPEFGGIFEYHDPTIEKCQYQDSEKNYLINRS